MQRQQAWLLTQSASSLSSIAMTPLINEGESELTAGTYVSTVSQCSSCHNTVALSNGARRSGSGRNALTHL